MWQRTTLSPPPIRPFLLSSRFSGTQAPRRLALTRATQPAALRGRRVGCGAPLTDQALGAACPPLPGLLWSWLKCGHGAGPPVPLR